MWRYIVRRLLWVAVVVLIITLITFLIFFVMPPTDPAVAFAGKQYGWPGLGFSFATRQSVRSLLLDRVAITTQLALGAALVWVCIGIPIGIVSAVKRRTLVDRLSMGLALFFVSAPVFWLGLMALWLFWFKLGISAGTGYVSIATSFGSWLNHMILPWVVLALLFAAFYARMT